MILQDTELLLTWGFYLLFLFPLEMHQFEVGKVGVFIDTAITA